MKCINYLRFAMGKTKGFTLIEIMITVAIVAILAAIGMPAYNGYITKSEIRTVQADLLALSLNFENRYQRTLSYPSFTDAQKANTQGIKQVLSGWHSSATNFNFKVEERTDSTYKITAEGLNNQANCKISLTHDNLRTSTGCKYVVEGNWL